MNKSVKSINNTDPKLLNSRLQVKKLHFNFFAITNYICSISIQHCKHDKGDTHILVWRWNILSNVYIHDFLSVKIASLGRGFSVTRGTEHTTEKEREKEMKHTATSMRYLQTPCQCRPVQGLCSVNDTLPITLHMLSHLLSVPITFTGCPRTKPYMGVLLSLYC